MKEEMLITLSHTLKGYLTEPNATRVIQKTLRALEQQLHANYSYIALQNKNTSYLDIAFSQGVSRTSLQNFHKKIGSNTIGRVFFKDHFTVVTPHENEDDYNELKIENDYEVCVAVHIGWSGRTFGFLACYFEDEITLDHAKKNFLMSMAGACSAALEKEELLRIISELKQFDTETGIYSHQFFITKLEEEIFRSHMNKKPLSLVIMDMDNYKSTINLYGNDTAHLMLRETAEEFKGHIRGCDVLGSLGMDEFILYMPDTPVEKAEQTVRDFIKKLNSRTFTSHQIKTSFSYGMTELKKDDDIEEFIQRAQLALYHARKKGDGTLVIQS